MTMGKIRKIGGHCIHAFLGSARQRYESRHFLLSAIAIRCGLRMYNRHLLWYDDPESQNVWEQFPEAVGSISERRYVLLSAARSIANVPGDSAECGVFRGAASFMILSSQVHAAKQHHVFDSFEGLSAPDERDKVDPEGVHYSWQKNDLSTPQAVAEKNLSAFSNVHYHRGWIPARFAEVETRRFSLVHIDVDLYQPTYDSLAFFYPRMNAGGLIVCDDYGFNTCPGAKAAFDDFFAEKPEGVIHLTTGQALVFKR